MKTIGVVLLAALATVTTVDGERKERTPSNCVWEEGQNLYERLTKPCANAGPYKYFRSRRAPRLPAETAERTPSRHPRTLNKHENLIKRIERQINETTTKKSLTMNKAELYQQSNSLQKRDAQEALNEFKNKFIWKNNARVLDIGSGDGGVTTTILKNFIPADYANLTGVDVSERMVAYANEHHHDSRTNFLVLNIADELQPDFNNRFDNIFSFYTIHWIRDQDRAFGNMYVMLAEGGECLLIFLGHMPLYDVFRRLARRPLWTTYLKDVESFVSPYHDSKDPEKDIRRLMANKGFRSIDVRLEHKNFVFPNVQIVRAAVTAVNPFPIPANETEAFLDDYLEIARELNFIDKDEHAVNIGFNYTLIVAYGKKEAS